MPLTVEFLDWGEFATKYPLKFASGEEISAILPTGAFMVIRPEKADSLNSQWKI